MCIRDSDGRENPLFKTPEKSIIANPTALVFTAAGESKEVVVTASGDYTVGEAPTGFTVNKTATGLTVTAAANEGEAARSGSIEVVLAEAPAKKAVITLNQPNA